MYSFPQPTCAHRYAVPFQLVSDPSRGARTKRTASLENHPFGSRGATTARTACRPNCRPHARSRWCASPVAEAKRPLHCGQARFDGRWAAELRCCVGQLTRATPPTILRFASVSHRRLHGPQNRWSSSSCLSLRSAVGQVSEHSGSRHANGKWFAVAWCAATAPAPPKTKGQAPHSCRGGLCPVALVCLSLAARPAGNTLAQVAQVYSIGRSEW